MRVIDLNADVGEWDRHPSPTDAALLSIVSSANIACGGHAGSETSMAETVRLAAAHHVSIGAHPGFQDREHFGRREHSIPAVEVSHLVRSQVDRLGRIATASGVELRHVKPHGALYNLAARDEAVADAVAHAVASVNPRLVLYGLAGSALIRAGARAGLRTASEVFADRGYEADGSLASRGIDGAVIDEPDLVAERAVGMVLDQALVAIDGSRRPVVAETMCIHGDTPGAVELARRVRRALERAGVRISAIG